MVAEVVVSGDLAVVDFVEVELAIAGLMGELAGVVAVGYSEECYVARVFEV